MNATVAITPKHTPRVWPFLWAGSEWFTRSRSCSPCPRDEGCYYPHFTVGEAEGKGRPVDCPRSPS